MATWLDNFLARFGYSKKAEGENYPGWLLAAADSDSAYQPNFSVTQAQLDLYRRLSWVYVAVETIGKAAANVTLNVKSFDGEDEEDLPNHPFEQLLRRPNPRDSRYEFIRDSAMYYSLTGHCYWWLNRASETQAPAEMWIIEPDRLRPLPDGNMYIRGYMYNPGNGPEIEIPTWQIAHFRGFNPFDRWVGLSPVESIAATATGDMGMAQWNAKLFTSSNGRLPGILAFADNIIQSDWEQMKVDVKKASALREIMMLRNVKQGGVQWIQSAVSQREMEFLAGRQANRDEIWNVFAPGLTQIMIPNATEANAKAGKATFIELTLWPMLTLMAEKITQAILPAYGENLAAEFEDIRITDRMLKLSEMQEYAKTHTIDEIRAEYYGDDPIEKVTKLDGDKRGFMLPAQINASTPIEEAEEPEPEAPPMLPGMQPGQPAPDLPGEDVGEQEEPEAEQPIEEEVPDEEDAAATKALAAWRRYALRKVKAGHDPCQFDNPDLGEAVKAEMVARLKTCKTEEDVKAAFALRVNSPKPDVAALLEGLRLGVEALKAA